MDQPITTRLRYVSARKPDDLTLFLSKLGFRVQIYGAPVWDGERWFLWFVPPDTLKINIGNVKLK